ncbi:hypothetical protein ABEB36_000292 [Hypothenemus hampei]|uniref:MADF domain-containing protein n=1 Tax=Hypothenemus hampei TaxID=57062 RepID=A0ABD1FAT5_HYPHA
MKSYPCLYNPKNRFYSNKHARADALNKIKEDMNISQLTVEDIKTKINNIRSQISHELKKTRGSSKSGLGTDERYEPIWWFDLAQFLIPFVKPRTGKDTLGNSMDNKKSTIVLADDTNGNTEYTSDLTTDYSSEDPTPSASTQTSKISLGIKRKKVRNETDSVGAYSKTIETLKVLNNNIVTTWGL